MLNINPIISLKEVSKQFMVDTGAVPVLRDVSLQINSGELVVIVGPSGCGKSTLLHVILGLEVPNSGQVTVLQRNVYANGLNSITSSKDSSLEALSSEDERGFFRKQHIGMIYQQPQWVKALSVVENVALALSLNGVEKVEALQRARVVLEQVGMESWSNYFPTQLSSGQQQKVALARALITQPTIIIADEPTGNLDYESGQELMTLLQDLAKQGKTVVMVTHDLDYLRYADRVVKMLDGKIAQVDDEEGELETLKKAKKIQI